MEKHEKIGIYVQICFNVKIKNKLLQVNSAREWLVRGWQKMGSKGQKNIYIYLGNKKVSLNENPWFSNKDKILFESDWKQTVFIMV